MSSQHYTAQWKFAQAELRQLLNDELPPARPKSEIPVDGTGDAVPKPQHEPIADRIEVIKLLKSRFVKYLRSVKRLDECYDQILQPQKRRLIKLLLDQSMGRLLEIKRELVEMDCSEFHYLDDVLIDLKLTPDDIIMPIPQYFLQEQTLLDRQELLKSMMNKFNIPSYHNLFPLAVEKPMSTEEALKTIQKHERARQGVLRSHAMEQIQKEDAKRLRNETAKLPKQMAVDRISMWYYKIITNRKTNFMRKDELKFIGMTNSDQVGNANLPSILRNVVTEEDRKSNVAKAMRREKRTLHEAGYQNALVSIKETLRAVEGPDMKERMQDQIRDWYISNKEQLGKFPEYPSQEDAGSLSIDFRKKTAEEVQAEIDAKAEAKGKKGKGKGKGKGKKEEKKGKKDKKGKKGDDEEGPAGWIPKESKFLGGLEEFGGSRGLKENVDTYENVWENKDENNNFDQIHDSGIIRNDKIREVELEIREGVDEIMRAELEQLIQALDKPKKGKKGKGKKGKGKGKKGKGKKGKKEKDYTPNRTIESLYEELVQNQIMIKPKQMKMKDFQGSYSYLANCLRTRDIEPSPSAHDIKNLISLYCVLPLGSQEVHEHAPHMKSILITGPKGTGKRSLVDIVCSETGANLIDLSPANVHNKYPGKAGLNVLLNMCIKVGREYPPTVVAISGVEGMFMKKAPKGAAFDPRRLKKDFFKSFMKLLKPGDRITVIGTSDEPQLGDMKPMMKVFDKVVLIQKPDYGARKELWEWFIMCRLNSIKNMNNESKNQELKNQIKIDVSSITKVSEGYTAGMIEQVVFTTMTDRRLENIERKPLVGKEFIPTLSTIDPIFKEEEDAFIAWYKKTPLGKKREKLAKSAMGEEEAGGKKGKGKGKKK